MIRLLGIIFVLGIGSMGPVWAAGGHGISGREAPKEVTSEKSKHCHGGGESN